MADSLVTCGAEVTLNGQWDPALVALSCIVAVGGSFAGLDCADRMRSATNRKSRNRYFFAGALLIGVSIWSMHFVGMLALGLGIPVQYDATLSTVSVAAAALGAGLAFLIVDRAEVTRFHVLTGGVAMGLAIASMHYLGMASMRIPAIICYHPYLFAASIGIAVTASTGALALARQPLASSRIRYWVKSVSAVALGAAIAGMHYVGMSAARYVPTGSTLAGEGALVGSWSLQALLVVAALVILAALLALASKSSTERQVALESLEQKRHEAIEALKTKDAFLASLSHELRTPLNPALLLATDCSTNPDFPRSARESFGIIARNILLEARLIDDLLDVTRISRGALKLEPRTVDAHAVLNDAIGVIRPDLEAKNLQLVVTLEANQTALYADPDRLQQVFWNLLLNAAKFSAPGGAIQVNSRNEGSRLCVQVRDAGLGMTESEVARCFESFEQGEHGLGGLGLGLAISRSIIERHQGSIAATSAGRGHGSTFTVLLDTIPAPPRPVENLPGVVSSPATRRKLALLLVEDHESSRVALARLLQRRGHEVMPVSTFAEAMEAGQQRKFDVLISDIGLPDGSGYELMQSLRAIQPLIGIAVTGYGTEDDLRKAKMAGFSTQVTKPVTVRQLDDAIAFAVRQGTESAPKV